MVIRFVGKRIEIRKSKYIPPENGKSVTGLEVQASFKIDNKGVEFTEFPATVFVKRAEENITDIFNEEECEEIATWLDNARQEDRLERLNKEWLYLPLQMKRLLDGIKSGHLITDNESIERFNKASEILNSKF